MDGQANLKRIGGFLVVAVIVAFAVHVAALAMFNQRALEVHGADASSATYMEIDARKDSTSTWLKRDYDLGGEKVDLTGATIDGTLHNASDDTIGDWNLRINIAGDCFINQAWNGEVEIHQFTGTAEEAVQRLNLQNYDLHDVQLAYNYDGDLLIPLRAGDYVLYYPSEKFKEVPLAGNDSAKIGVIFYYLGSLDLSDYDLMFKYHRTFAQGPTFVLLAVLIVLALVSILVYKVGDVAYKRAQNELELRKSGLSMLSDMYAAIYIIDLRTDAMTPVTVDDQARKKRIWAGGAKALLDKIAADAAEEYRDVMREFTDTGTLADRLATRDSIVCEFVSMTYGWSSMRFFAMDRVAGEPIEKVVCTVQDVNDEKREVDRVERRISEAELESRAKSAFLANVSRELRVPIHEMLDLGGQIAESSGDERVRSYAGELHRAGMGLLAFIESILDYSDLESGRLKLVQTTYSLADLTAEIESEIALLARRQRLAFDVDLSPDLPRKLNGDAVRLKQVIGNLLASGALMTEDGALKLSIFGKIEGGAVHLLVSVCATGSSSAEAPGRHAWCDTAPAGSAAGVGMDLAVGLLALMGSELKTVQSEGAWYECYFELDQEIVDAALPGRAEMGA